MAAGVVDVLERRQRPVAGPRGKVGELGDLEERDGRLAPQRGERTVAAVVVPLPEVDGPEIDVAERDVWGRRAVVPPRNTGPTDCWRHH
jgi:hypothetical protein